MSKTMTSQYPDDADGQALQGVAAEGSDMTKPMAIDFHVAAPDEAAAQQVAAKAAELGYQPEIFFDDEEEDLDGEPLLPWTVECTKTMVPEYDAIIAAQKELDEIARPLGAFADGWGTYGNVDDSP